MKKINEKEIIDAEYEPIDDKEEIFEDPLTIDEKTLLVESKNNTFEKLNPINEQKLFAKTGNTEIDFSKYDAQELHKKNATKSKSPTKKQRRSHVKQVKQSRRRNRH